MSKTPDRRFTFKRELDLNHILTVVSVLIAAGGLYYQAATTSIARRDLNSKLSDIAEVASELRHESADRKKNEVKTLQDRVDDLQQANKLARAELDTADDTSRNIAQQDEIFARCLFALSRMLKPGATIDDVRRRNVIDGIMFIQASTVHSAQAILKNVRERKEAAATAHKALEEIDRSDLPEPKRRARRDEVLATLEAEISLANSRLEQVLGDAAEKKRKLEEMLQEIGIQSSN